MSYRCFSLRRMFVPHLEGGLAGRDAGRLERHLAGCKKCGQLFQRVRSGHEAGRQFGRLGPAPVGRPPEFEEVWAALGAASAPAPRAAGPFVRSLSSPLAVRVLLVLIAAQSVLLVATNWKKVAGPRSGQASPGPTLDLRGYTPLAIPEFPAKPGFRIVTEGFVQAVYFDEEERSLHIKLVDVPHSTKPFVICEVRDFRGLTIPREGSRVRVYGTARYDAQPGRGWHEVNPVMDIAVLKR